MESQGIVEALQRWLDEPQLLLCEFSSLNAETAHVMDEAA